MAIHSSILAGIIPWTGSLADYSPRGCKESDMTGHACKKYLLHDLRLIKPMDIELQIEGIKYRENKLSYTKIFNLEKDYCLNPQGTPVYWVNT